MPPTSTSLLISEISNLESLITRFVGASTLSNKVVEIVSLIEKYTSQEKINENGETIYEPISHELKFYNLDGGKNCSTYSWNEGGAHVTSIVGVTDEGLIVISWGNKFLITYEDLYLDNFSLISMKLELDVLQKFESIESLSTETNSIETLNNESASSFFPLPISELILGSITVLTPDITPTVIFTILSAL